MIEGFEELKGFSNYLINKEGKVWSKKSDKLLSPSPNTSGYLKVNFWVDGKNISREIHRLLGLQYIDNPDNLECIDHIDRNRQNNSLDNLRWISKMGNSNNLTKDRGCICQGCQRGNQYYWRGYITIMGKQYKKQSKDKEVVEEWLKKIKEEHNIEC